MNSIIRQWQFAGWRTRWWIGFALCGIITVLLSMETRKVEADVHQHRWTAYRWRCTQRICMEYTLKEVVCAECGEHKAIK